MPFEKKTFQEITDEILAQLTKGVVNEQLDFEADRLRYPLKNSNIAEIVKISGTVATTSHVFLEGTDFRPNGDGVEWLEGGAHPDDHTPFFVNYTLDAPRTITDINPGSVTRTIVESVAREMEFLYLQMEQVYNLAYLDTAEGKALDQVVALLGIKRKGPGYATGEVIFGRKREPGVVAVTEESHTFISGKHIVLAHPQVREITAVSGQSGENPAVFTEHTDFVREGNRLVWLEGGTRPDEASTIMVDYAAYEMIAIAPGTKVSTTIPHPEERRVFVTIEKAELLPNADGSWEATVPVRAATPGRRSNVYSRTLTLMARPLTGVEYVFNPTDILNGTDAEGDEDLRAKARKALHLAGKATIDSLRAAVEGVDGVIEVKVVDQVDGVPGLVQLIAYGGEEDEIRAAIDTTRAAGIRVEFSRPREVPVDIDLVLRLEDGGDAARATAGVRDAVSAYITASGLGEEVIINRIVRAALSVAGVLDVTDVAVNQKRANLPLGTDGKSVVRDLSIQVEQDGGNKGSSMQRRA
ncbi:MAG: baseplate J/gp47 family protein [Methanomicrobiaceae archaeon]|nr:baseplate J/gp47 family protein [Methanomicrobiaceae archaeon]